MNEDADAGRLKELTYLVRALGRLEGRFRSTGRIIHRVTRLVEKMRPFEKLRCYAPGHQPQMGSDRHRRQAPIALECLGEVLSAPHCQSKDGRRFTSLVAQCLKQAWPFLMCWLEVLNPKRLCREERNPGDDLVRIVARVISGLFSYKNHLAHLFDKTPLVYNLLLDLWLNLENYSPPSGDSAQNLLGSIGLSKAVFYHALWSCGVRHEPHTEHCVCEAALKSARLTTKNHIHLLYACALVRAQMAVGTVHAKIRRGQSGPAIDLMLGVAMANLNTIVIMSAMPILPIRRVPRTITDGLVKMIADLDGISLAHEAWSAACVALLAIWKVEGSQKALVRSLRMGALQSMMGLDDKDAGVRAVLHYVCEMSVHVNVARAIPAQTVLDALPEKERVRLRHRAALASEIYKKACAAPGCHVSRGTGHRHMRRCTCLNVCYCSVQCQKRDWKLHRQSHTGGIIQLKGTLQKLGAHWLQRIGQEVANDSARTIVSMIQAALDDPRCPPRPLIHLTVTVSGLSYHLFTRVHSQSQLPSLLRDVRLRDSAIVLITAGIRNSPSGERGQERIRDGDADPYQALVVLDHPLPAIIPSLTAGRKPHIVCTLTPRDTSGSTKGR